MKLLADDAVEARKGSFRNLALILYITDRLDTLGVEAGMFQRLRLARYR